MTASIAGVDVFSARHDHVLRAVENVEISVRIAIADVARTEKSVATRFGRFLRTVPVGAHDVRPSAHQLAGLSDGDVPTGLVDGPQVNTRTGAPARQEPLVRVLVVQQRG